MAVRPSKALSIVSAGVGWVAVVAVLACAVMPTTALAQPVAPPPNTPRSITLGGGVTGQAASYVPNVPLSARANQNLGGSAGLVYAHGMEFVRYTAINNPEARGVNNPNFRFGRVTQEFAIGRFEVPRAVWVEFYDALLYVNDNSAPGQGVAWAQFPSGGRPTNIPGQEMRPVGGISWRTAAILCNWLHNDRQWTREAFASGAYDISTFGWDPVNGRRFTDQREASAGARFRLPQWNEWTAATHYDPSAATPAGADGPGRWWQQPLTSDAAPVYGLPRAIVNGQQAQANAGTGASGVLLGSYSTAQTPWGLLDTAGGMTEWTETYSESPFSGVNARSFDGSSWRGSTILDFASLDGGDDPSIPDWEYGVRLIHMVPTPSSAVLLGLSCVVVTCRNRRR
jgi:formylglycine-generating enzyme required for sulfatase activity